jgi:glycosyltransferase involved in cell wall biosynthesis
VLASVIIPTYNRRQLVAEAVASVLAQQGLARTDWELIVVDDGSTDGTPDDLVSRFGCAVRIERLRTRCGVSTARNVGVALARGEWLAFLDSDDLWRPHKLARHLAFAESTGTAISQTQEIWIRNGRFVNPRAVHRKRAGDIFLPSLQRCLVSPSAVLLHRSVWDRYGPFDPSLPACEDYDLWLRIAVHEQFGLLDEALVLKRGGHEDQLSRCFWGMDRFRVASLLRLLFSDILDARRARATADTIESKCAILAAGAEKRGHHNEAQRYRELAAAAREYVATRWPAQLAEAAA